MMKDFAAYYNKKFQDDLNIFFSTIPDESKFHGNTSNEVTIQYQRLTRDFDHLNFLTTDDKINFGVALYFTVLVDEVCYTHFKEHYEKFRELTHYPKFIGDCLSACHLHFHPNEIFHAMNRIRKRPLSHPSNVRLKFGEKLEEALPIMEKETKEFFAKYLMEVDGQAFWDLSKAEVELLQ